MKVIHLKDIPQQENTSSLFTAPITTQPAITEKESQYNVTYVHFPEGVRNKFHTHSNEQILIVTEGRGMVATEDEEIEIGVGDVVLIEAGEKHRHGAIPGSSMTHVAITPAFTKLEQIEE